MSVKAATLCGRSMVFCSTLILITVLQLMYTYTHSNRTDVSVKTFIDTMNLNNNYEIEGVKVISFSLYGTNGCYQWGALENALIANKLFNDWKVYIYVGQEIMTSNIVHILESLRNVKLIIMNNSKIHRNTMWRFLAAFDNNIDILISRDTDSRLNIRDKTGVYEWLNSDKDFHIIRDQTNHIQPILAGAWGVRNHLLLPFKSMFNEFYYNNKSRIKWGDDQKFLADVIYPYIIQKNKSYALVHDEFQNYHTTLPEMPHKIQYRWTTTTFIGHTQCGNFENINKIYRLNLKSFTRKRENNI